MKDFDAWNEIKKQINATQINKNLPFYHTFKFKNGNSTAILSQARLFDAKRLKFRYGKVSKRDFRETKEKLTKLFQ